MDSETRETGPADATKAEKRNPHSIRFLDGEWERIEAHADARGLTGPEFVRFAALAALAGDGETGNRLVPLVETTFRAAHILVTKLRSDMLGEDRGEELDEIVAGARAHQDRLLEGPSSRPPDGTDLGKEGAAGAGDGSVPQAERG